MIDTRDLSIQDSAFDGKMFSDPCGEISEAAKCVSVSRNELPLAGVDTRECPETVYLQFKDELVGIERFIAAGEPYGA